MNSKSKTCFSTRTRAPLTEYYNKTDAESGATYVFHNYGTSLTPYYCNVCGFWHLSPAERITPSKPCPLCQNSNGEHKELYKNKQDAENRAKILYKEQRVSLKVYKCPHFNGWHLTKKERY